jgi:hypothetical protein
MKRQPNRRESYHVRDALEHLQNKRYREAEEALTKAEHIAPLPAHTASMLAIIARGAPQLEAGLPVEHE